MVAGAIPRTTARLPSESLARECRASKHLAAQHLPELKPSLECMRTEDIGPVAMDAFERADAG